MPDYAELQVTSHFSFLRGASGMEDLFARAAVLGIPALGITDRNTVAGIVRAHQRAKEASVRLVPGCRLDLTDGASVLVYPTDRPAWSRLCRLLTIGKGRAGKGACTLGWDDLADHATGLLATLCDGADAERLHRLRDIFGDRAYLALTPRHRPNDAVRLQQFQDLARAARVATVATNDVLYHAPGRRILQDVLTCIREGCTIDDAGFRRERSVTRHLQPPAEMARLLARHSDALARTMEIVERATFSLDTLRYQYPHEVHIPGLTAQQTLERLTWEGATNRYGPVLPDAVTKQLRHELTLIAQLDYAPYFLTVDSIVRFARSRNILCQGRGSAANSAVCYVLGITSIDPTRSGLLFERFISAERREPPDIDVDFEHERREEVIQWIYETYGRHRAALCATIIRYRGRGAVRDVGKALGLSEDVTAALASQISHWGADEITEDHITELNLNPNDRRLRLTIELTRALVGFPRHLSQHPGGFVLTQDRLDELVPIEPAAMKDRQVIEWDKDDIETLRFMKVDVLGLGMLGCMRRAFNLLAEHKDIRIDLADVPAEDPATYEMIRRADTLGTFQIESRAQMSMLPRLKPRTFYDLVIQVAIVRPGPIQGDMVHPYLRRREGIEPVEYPTPELRRVLEKTLGVPLFQEQAMQVAIVCAGFTPGEADSLRRSMATFKFTGGVHHFRDKMISGMTERGYTEEFASETFSRIEGFGSYGFPESHAASFALIAYASAWMKCHHPDVFCAALLNAQPMGFYAPAQIVRDAREHGVTVRPVCVNASAWDCTLEGPGVVRLGLRMVKGLAEAHAVRLMERRGAGYRSVRDAWRAGIQVASLERLAEADGFHALGLDRRTALWAVRGLSDDRLPLLDLMEDVGAPGGEESGAGDEDSATTGMRDCFITTGGESAGCTPPLPLREGAGGRGSNPPVRAATPLPPSPSLKGRGSVEAPSLPFPTVAASSLSSSILEEPLPPQPTIEPPPPTDPTNEPPVPLRPMTDGRQVVEDYRSTGLSLRRHPVSFLRTDLDARRIVRCADLATIPDGRRLTTAGIVLVRQRPGSARGVLFMTIEDETAHANLIVWPSVFEAQRRLILSASMISCRGRLQRESGVIHVIAEELIDLSALLQTVGDHANAPIQPAGRGDEARRPVTPDPRPGSQTEKGVGGREARDIHVHGRRPSYHIRVPTRDFR